MRRVGRSILVAAFVASDARGQKVLLELRPHMGDTLRMQMEQVTEMRGSRPGAPPALSTTTMRMYSRAIVESTAHIASLILAITDSVDVSSSDANSRAMAEGVERELEGRQMRLRLWPDGAVTLNDGKASVPREVSELVSVMPASFPARPVGVGETWIREMPIPSGTALGIPAGSVVRTRFRLDSVSANRELAFVAMSGSLAPVASTTDSTVVDGTVSGSLVVDRRRGWLSESRFQLELRSTASRLVAGRAAAGPTRVANGDALRFRVRVSQSMKVLKPTATAARPR